MLGAVGAGADTLRIASFNAELGRDGPGLLYRDIARGLDQQVRAVLDVIAQTKPDVLALQGFDWDAENAALLAFAEALHEAGHAMPHVFSAEPNSGLATDLDLDGDGRLGGRADAQGYGAFRGQNGIAVLSVFPIDGAGTRAYSDLLWMDLPGANLPTHPDGTAFPSPDAQGIQRLSNTAHWAVPISVGTDSILTLLTFQAAPPVFDGPEDRNGRRNADEILLWQHLLDGALGPPPTGPFVIAGGANLDPVEGDGRHGAIQRLLGDARLQDPAPSAEPVDGQDPTDTVDWTGIGVGQLRVDYVLPSGDLMVTGAGIVWPSANSPLGEAVRTASRHRLVWVDIALP